MVSKWRWLFLLVLAGNLRAGLLAALANLANLCTGHQSSHILHIRQLAGDWTAGLRTVDVANKQLGMPERLWTRVALSVD